MISTVYLGVLAALPGRGDIVIADFEAPTYGGWTATGTAFGTGPARGTHPGQMRVDGFRGKGLVNTYLGGDAATGTLTSPGFTIERKRIKFLLGGGQDAENLRVDLFIEGRVVRTATGPNDRPGGSEALAWASWDVEEFSGKKATIRIVAFFPENSSTSQLAQASASLPPGRSFGPVAVRTTRPSIKRSTLRFSASWPPPRRNLIRFRSMVNPGEVSVPVAASPPR